MVLNNFPLKNYQENLLDAFSDFLSRTRELKNPRLAFLERTRISYHPLPGSEETPYVCLRVPTGGGKTRIAGHAIARVNKDFLATDSSLTLWLVPSEPIREQTLFCLKTPGELLHEDMRELFGTVNVLSIDDALSVQPATLNSANTIIVATMQSFKRDTTEGLRVYRQNGSEMPNFDGVSVTQRGEGSLFDVIRLRRPFVIIDEAHNQGTPLAIDTVARFEPSCVLELTATPDRANQPSNVLCSVSAYVLQLENMLKLPLELNMHPDWRRTLNEAVSRLQSLTKEAQKEEKATGEIIRPVVLIQAERKAQGKETFTPECVKKALMDDYKIPAETIAIATGSLDELGDRKPGEPDYPQFIITVDKLREGWDCPFAYILFSFRNSTSATAVEQILGRVLRMPHVCRKTIETLNRSYAYVVSNDFAETVEGLKDGLVQSGFERFETQELIQTPETQADDLFNPIKKDVTVSLPETDGEIDVPDSDAVAKLPTSLRKRVEISPETGTLTIKAGASSKEIEAISKTFRKPEAAATVKKQLTVAAERNQHPEVKEKTPAEKGVIAYIPLLCIKRDGQIEIFDDSVLMDADWEIDSFDYKLTEAEFSSDPVKLKRGLLTLSELEKVEYKDADFFEKLDLTTELFGRETDWKITDLIGWLDRQLYAPYADHGQRQAWLYKLIRHLQDERGLTLERLIYQRFPLREAIKRKLTNGEEHARKQVQAKLFQDDANFLVCDDPNLSPELFVVLKNGSYGCNTRYTGAIHLGRHFFPVIENLKTSGEEFKCAQYIANDLEDVEWWVRNPEKQLNAFWLQTPQGKFYPDFLVRMKSGLTLVVEYKGKHLDQTEDSRLKKIAGQCWEGRDKDQRRFIWIVGQNWKSAIKDALER